MKDNFGCLIIDVKNIINMSSVLFYEDKMILDNYLDNFVLSYEIVKDSIEIEEKIVKLFKKMVLFVAE